MPSDKELRDAEASLKQQYKVSRKSIEKAIIDKSARTTKTQLVKIRGQLNDLETNIVAQLTKLEGQPGYDKVLEEWVTFSNDAEEKYAEFQEAYDQMDNRVVVDPIRQERIKALETSLKTRCDANKKIVDDLVKAVGEENKEATLTRAKYNHYTNVLDEIKKEYQSDLKNILKELVSLDPAKHDSY